MIYQAAAEHVCEKKIAVPNFLSLHGVCRKQFQRRLFFPRNNFPRILSSSALVQFFETRKDLFLPFIHNFPWK